MSSVAIETLAKYGINVAKLDGKEYETSSLEEFSNWLKSAERDVSIVTCKTKKQHKKHSFNSLNTSLYEQKIGVFTNDVGSDHIVSCRENLKILKFLQSELKFWTKTTRSIGAENEEEKLSIQYFKQKTLLFDCETVPLDVIVALTDLKLVGKRILTHYLWAQPDKSPKLKHLVTWKDVFEFGLKEENMVKANFAVERITLAEGLEFKDLILQRKEESKSWALRTGFVEQCNLANIISVLKILQ